MKSIRQIRRILLVSSGGFLASSYEERPPFAHMGNIEDGVSSEAVSDDTLIEIVANFDNAGDAGEAHYFFKAIYDDFEEG